MHTSTGLDYIPEVVQVVEGPNHTVYVYFQDGAVKLYDAKPLLQRGGVFEPLKDDDFFSSRLTVMNSTLAWDVSGTRDATCCIDLDPCALYAESTKVADPLQTA